MNISQNGVKKRNGELFYIKNSKQIWRRTNFEKSSWRRTLRKLLLDALHKGGCTFSLKSFEIASNCPSYDHNSIILVAPILKN